MLPAPEVAEKQGQLDAGNPVKGTLTRLAVLLRRRRRRISEEWSKVDSGESHVAGCSIEFLTFDLRFFPTEF